MPKFLVTLLLSACFALGALGDDKQKAAQLRKEITELRAQLEAKEAELAKVDPVEYVPGLFSTSLKVGTAGPFQATLTQNGKSLGPAGIDTFKVVKVLDENRAIVRVAASTTVRSGRATSTYGEFILIGSTKGLADDTGLKPKAYFFRVTGTEKVADRTLFTVEPTGPPPKK